MTGAVVGPFGGDKLAHVNYLQRVNTTGGLKPSSGCTASTVNTRKLVDYTADYYFYEQLANRAISSPGHSLIGLTVMRGTPAYLTVAFR